MAHLLKHRLNFFYVFIFLIAGRTSSSDKSSNYFLNKYKCPKLLCYYSTDRKSDMNAHSVTHSAYKPYTCYFEGCSYASVRNCDLKKHLVVHGVIDINSAIKSDPEKLERIIKKTDLKLNPDITLPAYWSDSEIDE